MLLNGNWHAGGSFGRRAPNDLERVEVQSSLLARAGALRLRLAELAEERMLAREHGLGDNAAYCADLELEAAETRAAYAGAVILQLALLRAELEGRNEG